MRAIKTLNKNSETVLHDRTQAKISKNKKWLKAKKGKTEAGNVQTSKTGTEN